ncbi:MAG: HmuY family protein [Gemmatimonadetes bacterium]|nr:HmuY family protein [Gemmatimonadota bacterium]
MSRVPHIALGLGFAVFLVIMVVLLAPTAIKARVLTFNPTPPVTREAVAGGTVSDTLTIDAGDEHRWRFVDLDRGGVVEPPDTAGWDLALRRFHLIPSGEISNLGPVPFDSVNAAPESGYVASRFSRDTSNAATDHWYTYSYFSHLLTSKSDVYVLRTREGRYAKLQILSYYCPGPTPGCVTLRYFYQGGGGRALGSAIGAVTRHHSR